MEETKLGDVDRGGPVLERDLRGPETLKGFEGQEFLLYGMGG